MTCLEAKRERESARARACVCDGGNYFAFVMCLLGENKIEPGESGCQSAAAAAVDLTGSQNQ